jgi:ParB family transcriptional regulator, chromosome partitioning protein
VLRSHNKEAYYVRRLPTEGAVRASDKRALFVGVDAYEAAGGDVMRMVGCRTPCCSTGS